ncbi:MAG: PAS domain-containing protein [Burkholderiales bacterium]|nr:PAS domain-containing protein [Burkholderiales bacterium]
MDVRFARRVRGTLAASALALLPIAVDATPEPPATIPQAASASAPAVPASDPAPRVLHVVGADNYPPYLFRDEDGHPAGLVADEWALWEKKTGVHVDLQPMDWVDALRRVSDGQADVVDTVFWSSDRARTMDFTAPFADVREPIYADASVQGLVDLHSLRGFHVAALAGDVCIERLRAGGVTLIDTYPSYQRLIASAVAGGPKIFCMDGPSAEYYLYKANASQRFREAFVMYYGHMHRAVRRGDAATLALIDKGFDQISPAEKKAAEDKWFGAPLAGARWLHVALVAAGVLALAAVLALLWGLFLRRAVREKTAEIDSQARRLRTLIDTLPDLVWFKGVDGKFLACNVRFERFIGAPENELIGHPASAFLPAAVAAEFAAADKRAVEMQAPVPHQFTLTYAHDGHQEQVESLHTPVFGSHGELAGVLSIGRDVTQRRDDERHLRRLNRLYQVLTNVHAAIARERAPEPLLAAVCQIMVRDGGLRMAWIGRPDTEAGDLVPVAWAGKTGDYLDPPHASLAAGPRGHAPSAQAFREGRAMHSTDIGSDPGMATWRAGALALGYRSSSAFPLKSRGRTVGVFTMYSSAIQFFDAGELALLERLSEDIGHALESYELADERERALTDLRDSEARFATMFRMSPSGLGLARFEDKRYIDVNEAFIQMFGYSWEEAHNRSGLELNTWVDVKLRGQAMATLERDGEVRNVEAPFRTRSGDIFYASFSAMRVSIGREDLVVASYFDLTAQRLATRTLEERKLELERIVSQRTAELSRVLDAMPDRYFRIRQDGTVVDFRAGRHEDSFAEPSKLLGRRIADVLPAAAAEPLQRSIADAIASKGLVMTEYALPYPDGERHFEARTQALGTDQVIMFVRNITDRHSLEADRERARLNAVSLANAKSEFLANMSHEIRTPLNGLLGLAQIGQRDAAGTPTASTFAAILNSGRLLLGIVNDVLDFSKIEVGKLRVEQRPVSPHALAEEAVALLRDRAHEKGITLKLAFDPALPDRCLGDALRMQQVLVNLLSNAIKFTESGHVTVWAGLEPSLDPAHACMVYRVTDTGIGIATEHLKHLFDAFQQADTSTTRRFGGTGLGLAISKRLAELMGGVVKVTSELGAGSVFELRLPWLAATDVPQEREPRTSWGDQPRRLQGVRVLVAEDNEVNQLVLERALEIEGAEATIVGDGRQAVNRVLADGRESYDVVLMDIQMPEMDGYEATRRILELAPDLPVIGQTAHAMLDERRECLAAGMVDHIAKPLDFRLLADMIVRHID